MGQDWVGGWGALCNLLDRTWCLHSNRSQAGIDLKDRWEVKRRLTENSQTLFCGEVTRGWETAAKGWKVIRKRRGIIRAVASKRRVKGAVNATWSSGSCPKNTSGLESGSSLHLLNYLVINGFFSPSDNNWGQRTTISGQFFYVRYVSKYFNLAKERLPEWWIQNVRILLMIIYMCSLFIDSALTGLMYWGRFPVTVIAIQSTYTVTKSIVRSDKSVQPWEKRRCKWPWRKGQREQWHPRVPSYPQSGPKRAPS